MQECRQRAVDDGFLIYKNLVPYKCFYMHAMDFTATYVDQVVSIEVDELNEMGQNNVLIE